MARRIAANIAKLPGVSEDGVKPNRGFMENGQSVLPITS
jgi:hypothetical protein